MTATAPGREVDATVARTLAKSYRSLVKAGIDSVRAAWRFGQCIDSFTDSYTLVQLADSMNLSVGTLYRYIRLYRAYQRPELALDASRQLETFNIDTISQLQAQLGPIEHGRSLAGRHWRFRCHNCQSTDVHREEFAGDEASEDELAAVTG